MTNKEAKDIMQSLKFIVDDYSDSIEEAIDMAIEALLADAVEVIRCKDCKYSRIEGDTTQYRWCKCLSVAINDNDYCSYAERR